MKIKRMVTGIMAAVLLCIPATGVYASDGEEYVTITVQATDDNEGMTYALDNDDPGSFGPSNMFTIPAGTSHTIYVKDAAGNITSQVYEPPAAEQPGKAAPAEDHDTDGEEKDILSGSTGYPDSTYDDGYSDDVDVSGEYDGRTIDIDLELGKNQVGDGNEKPYEIKRDTPAEQGEGTVYSKTFLDGTDSSEQVFYSLTTEEGNVFYLLIDQGQENNNVYLLNQVSNRELSALATDSGSASGPSQDSGDDSLLKALSGAGNEGISADSSRTGTASKGGINSSVILLLVMAAGGAFYYYQKVYKAKKEQEIDAMEAADMDQFVGEDAEEEEFDFDYGDDDKEQYIRDLIREDEEEYAASAESEAVNAGWDRQNDTAEDGSGRDVDMSADDISGEDADMPVDDISSEDRDMPMDDIFSDSPEPYEYDPDLDGEE